MPSHIFLNTISDSRDERCSSHGNESRKGGAALSSSQGLEKHSPQQRDHPEASTTTLLPIDWRITASKFGLGLAYPAVLEHLPLLSVKSTASCSAQPHHSRTEASKCSRRKSPLGLQPARPFPGRQALGLGHSVSDLRHRQFENVQMTELSALNLSRSNLSPLSQASRLLNLSVTV